MIDPDNRGWLACLERKGSDCRIAHVIPVGDWREHVRTYACWCKPKITSYDYGSLVMHHAADGRKDPVK